MVRYTPESYALQTNVDGPRAQESPIKEVSVQERMVQVGRDDFWLDIQETTL